MVPVVLMIKIMIHEKLVAGLAIHLWQKPHPKILRFESIFI
jgi:hypothetical protein